MPNWKGVIKCIALHRQLTVVQCLAAEEAQAVKVEDGQTKQQVLVEEEEDHASDTGIGPAAVHQQQCLQESELGDAEVAAHHSLHALLTTDAHPCTVGRVTQLGFIIFNVMYCQS